MQHQLFDGALTLDQIMKYTMKLNSKMLGSTYLYDVVQDNVLVPTSTVGVFYS